MKAVVQKLLSEISENIKNGITKLLRHFGNAAGNISGKKVTLEAAVLLSLVFNIFISKPNGISVLLPLAAGVMIWFGVRIPKIMRVALYYYALPVGSLLLLWRREFSASLFTGEFDEPEPNKR